MRAVLHRSYGPPEVLELGEVPQPGLGEHDVLVRVQAASICRGDVHVLTGTPYLVRLMGYGLRRPGNPVLGQDLAGTVEAIGSGVTAFRPGDAVFGQVRAGAFAEYASVPEGRLAPRPATLDFTQAAAVPDSGLTALQGLRDVGELAAGQSVLVNGASGGVGTFAVQIASALGAEVTAVCSTRNAELVRSLGASAVVDYTRENFVERAARHDVLLDLVGNRSLADCRRVLKPGGVLVACAGGSGGKWFGPAGRLAAVALAGRLTRPRMSTFVLKSCGNDLRFLASLIDAGKLRPVIEQRFPLEQAVEAMRHVATGHTQGKTVIEIHGSTHRSL